MTQASTQHDLVRLVYNELPTLARLETEFALTQDPSARAEFEQLQAAARELPRAKFAPRPDTIAAILKYSRQCV